MDKVTLKELKQNGIKWFSGLDVDSSEYEGVWVKLPRNGISNSEKEKVFIHNAKLIHGDRYDYSLVEYNAQADVKIICSLHGEFRQNPNSHLQGHRCFACSDQRLTREEFIQKSKLIHGDRYDYSKIDYINVHTKVTIICPDHGEFEQVASNHMFGSGCRECSKPPSISTEEFIQKSKLIHGNRYDYSRVDYINTSTKVTIICNLHGEFKQPPNSHLAGNDCPECKQSVKPQTQIYLALFTHRQTGKKFHKIGITQNDDGIRPYRPETRKRYYIDLVDYFSVETEYARTVESMLLSAARKRYGKVRCPVIKYLALDGHRELIQYNPDLVADFDDWGKMYKKWSKSVIYSDND